MKKIVKLVFGLLLSGSVFAAGNLSAVNIEGIYVRESRTDIYLVENNNNPLGCTNAKRLVIITDEFSNSDAMLSAAIAAQMAGRKISGRAVSCHDGLQKLSSIYIEPN